MLAGGFVGTGLFWREEEGGEEEVVQVFASQDT